MNGDTRGAEESEELLKQYVQDSLILKSSGGGSKLYDQLVQELVRLKHVCEDQNIDQSSDKQLVALLRGVSRCLALVKEEHHEVLVTEILNIKLWQVSGEVRNAVLAFICQSVTVNGSFVHSALHILVYSLVPPPSAPVPDPCPGHSWSPSVEEVGIQNAVVSAAKRVLELVPTAVSRLLPILVSNLPHKVRDRQIHCLYLQGCFLIAESQHGSGLSDGLLSAVVAHLIDVDVDIKWEDIVEVMTEEAKEEVKGESPRRFDEPDIFDLEGMSEGEACLASHEPRGGWEGCGESEVINPIPAKKEHSAMSNVSIQVDEMADKMDSLMELVVSHLKRRISKGEIQMVWRSLLDAFEGIVLQTHRSKFTQFLVFYVASTSPVYCSRSLIQVLLNKLADKNQALIVRSACAAYIGSFLARAAFIPEVIVIETFQKLADWCVRYAREEDRRGGLPPIPSAGALGPNQDVATRHSSYYAACQALMYALCYHMEPLCHRQNQEEEQRDSPSQMAMSLDGDETSLREKCVGSIHRLFNDVIPNILNHSLDPLSSCARSVVTEFARQVQSLGYYAVANICISWERRVKSVDAQKHSRPLEIFFPFDPYLLRRSAEPLDLARNYVRWRKGHPAAIIPDDDYEDRQVVLGGSSSDDEVLSGVSKSHSDDDSSLLLSSSSESDDLKRTRFGSMPDSSVSSGGRRYLSRKLPGALKASLLAHGGLGGSPTGDIPILHGSPSTGNGSPLWGISPASASFPMSQTFSGDK
eukprot:CAMPEP_0118808542 /NCGR_PEP_ID=MMETSP1161-20130426/36035_1 /TAXON_ID=249345 /ORGANISM="Picochlorum oklahomensis, Strain CCMP2329" /LENGTH=754 /DNA_ID=CAMNT_0006737935 /DNA_START=101 /DNA_END=2365 /DNA_ORIENTATION=-